MKTKEIIARSNKKVWWICNKGHSWETSIYGRTKGVGCIYCTNQKQEAIHFVITNSTILDI